MRIVTTKIANAIDSPVQTPAYLIEINFSTIIRLCNRETVSYGGFTWYQGGAAVTGLATGEGGAKTATIELPNNQFAYSTIILAETASGRRVRIWKLFGEAPYQDEDAQLVFDGLIDDVPELTEKVVMNCSTQNLRTTSIPAITIGAPYFNHMPRTGQSIVWGGEIYDLEPR